ncbi:hypothetical protein [Phycicoccus sp. HDW14]|uniref:hypothetical protein n=1 Tax=Phycicoccus sp. HDW14 TaxID=2714941 RepID=UPI00197B4E16|nr:hypothetical protein [Phycicoccus sp. HDW14]
MTGTSRRFELQRDRDVSGVSGTGVVAEGVEFSDGVAVVRWLGEHRSTVVWPSIDSVRKIHGHNGATRVVYLDAGHADLGALLAEMVRGRRILMVALSSRVKPLLDELTAEAEASISAGCFTVLRGNGAEEIRDQHSIGQIVVMPPRSTRARAHVFDTVVVDERLSGDHRLHEEIAPTLVTAKSPRLIKDVQL